MDGFDIPPAPLARYNERQAEALRAFASILKASLQRLGPDADPDDVVNLVSRRLEHAGYRIHHRRQQHTPRTAPKVRMSKATAERIRRMKERHPDASQMEIAAALGVNAGRVSEVLAGVSTYTER